MLLFQDTCNSSRMRNAVKTPVILSNTRKSFYTPVGFIANAYQPFSNSRGPQSTSFQPFNEGVNFSVANHFLEFYLCNEKGDAAR